GSSSGSLAGAADADTKLAEIVRIVARSYAARGPAGDSVVTTLAALKGADRDLAASVLDGLVAGWPDGAASAPKLSDAEKAGVSAAAAALPADQKDRLLVLAGRWGQKDLFAGQ